MKKILVLFIAPVISFIFAVVYSLVMPYWIYDSELYRASIMLVPFLVSVAVVYRTNKNIIKTLLAVLVSQGILSNATNFDFRISTYGLIALGLYLYFKEEE